MVGAVAFVLSLVLGTLVWLLVDPLDRHGGGEF